MYSVEDRRRLAPPLTHREADTAGDDGEAKMHDGSVRLGPATAVNHLSDAMLVDTASLVAPIEPQQLGVGALEGVRIRWVALRFVTQQHRRAELVERRDARGRRATSSSSVRRRGGGA